MSTRLYDFDYANGTFSTPTIFYTRVAANPKVKPRLKKKAELIINHWEHLPELGQRQAENAISEKPCFKTWLRLMRELRKLDLGVTSRRTCSAGLKSAFNSTIDYYRNFV